MGESLKRQVFSDNPGIDIGTDGGHRFFQF